MLKGASQFNAEMKLDKPVALDELVWHRVRYEFRYDDRKSENLAERGVHSNILGFPCYALLGQQKLSGREVEAAVRRDCHRFEGRSNLRTKFGAY